jgi:hypothetical protein
VGLAAKADAAVAAAPTLDVDLRPVVEHAFDYRRRPRGAVLDWPRIPGSMQESARVGPAAWSLWRYSSPLTETTRPLRVS